jgi:hypothetical protein
MQAPWHLLTVQKLSATQSGYDNAHYLLENIAARLGLNRAGYVGNTDFICRGALGQRAYQLRPAYVSLCHSVGLDSRFWQYTRALCLSRESNALIVF